MPKLAILLLLTAACANGHSNRETPPTAGPTGCADVIDLKTFESGDATFTFSVTVASADTGWEKYADAWEVVTPDGTVLATRVLTHPHVDEQPFTRSQDAIAIPDGVDTVTVRAHDTVAGWCGAEMTFAISR